jgi:glycosyltransferase involved in cell wall biosynthesis
MTEKNEMIPGLVSVVICAWNNWPALEMTIASALHQSYQAIEVIVVDNSSGDETPNEVCKRFGRKVRYIRQPNRGCAGAHNTGFAMASGEFIQFVAGDDVLAPNKIAKQVRYFLANPELDIVYGDIRNFRMSGGGAAWSDVPTQQEDDMLRALIILEKHGAGINALGTLFRRRALERVGPWDENLYCEDTDYWLRAAYAGCLFGLCSGSPMGFKRLWEGQKIANVPATVRGLEAVWDKARGYITEEPYCSLLSDRLAEYRFLMAISPGLMARPEALAMLALARTTSPKKVSSLVYALGYAAIVVPGGAFLVRSRGLRSIRRLLAALVGFVN